MYLRNRPTGEIKKYIDWILGPEGQSIVTEIGYFPVK
jgi:phosphate transport system substrate-binding protein